MAQYCIWKGRCGPDASLTPASRFTWTAELLFGGYTDVGVTTKAGVRSGSSDRQIRQQWNVEDGSTGFSLNVLLWNGTLYSLTIFILNSLHLIFSVAAIFDEGNDNESKVVAFTDP
ncbi:hypothetical protein C8Q80DRAFT_1121328 [Daedaleopsis nitida]|nr:hypothetical protein C8Q80DRAFT_1121328 [Daedaleopsis nitida]